jgi:hypothetical protein
MKSLLSIFLILILSSCTITKRHYTSGYHIEWKTKKHQSNSDQVESKEIASSFESKGHSDSAFMEVDTELNEETTTKKIQFLTPAIQPLKATLPNVAKFYRVTKGTNERFLHKLNYQHKIKNKKSRNPYGEIYLRTPREYLIGALWALIIGAVLVGIAILLIVVVEVEGLSVGGIFVYLMFLVGAVCLIAVPISLLLALVAYLVG